jgi:hypothetical protein
MFEGTMRGGGARTWLLLTVIDGVEVSGLAFITVDPAAALGNAVCWADKDGVPCGAMKVARNWAGGRRGFRFLLVGLVG